MEDEPTRTAWQQILYVSKAISGTLQDYFECIYNRELGRLEESWQRYLWLFTILAATSIIIIPVIGIVLSEKSIRAEYSGRSPSPATSRPKASAEELAETYASRNPPTAEKFKLYTLPKPLHFMASPLEINYASTPRHIGQLSEFVRLIDPWGPILWIGLGSYRRLPSFYSDENADVFMGSKAYEVVVGQPVRKDDATSRVDVVPTGRVLGDVVGVYVDNVTLLLQMEDWFTESDLFRMGMWENVVNKRVQAENGGAAMEVDALE